eukprot:12476293-Prorocentrum_lima.AAC.1
MADYGLIHSDYLLAVQQVMTDRSCMAKLMHGHVFQQILQHPNLGNVGDMQHVKGHQGWAQDDPST